MKKTEWESHRRHLKNTLKFSILMPLYIIIWAICIVAALALEMIWEIERRPQKGKSEYGE